MKLPARVKVVDVGPRDGLQNESAALSVEDRVEFCRALIDAGLPVVEPGALVSPKRVPQMAGSEDVFKALPKDRARLPMLVPNRQGYERAKVAGVNAIAIFTAASDTFNLKNTNATIDESFRRFEEFTGAAKASGMWVRGYISTCFGCPYEGKVDPVKVAGVTRRLIDLGCDEISLGDTIGVAVPSSRFLVRGPMRSMNSSRLLGSPLFSPNPPRRRALCASSRMTVPNFRFNRKRPSSES